MPRSANTRNTTDNWARWPPMNDPLITNFSENSHIPYTKLNTEPIIMSTLSPMNVDLTFIRYFDNSIFHKIDQGLSTSLQFNYINKGFKWIYFYNNFTDFSVVIKVWIFLTLSLTMSFEFTFVTKKFNSKTYLMFYLFSVVLSLKTLLVLFTFGFR